MDKDIKNLNLEELSDLLVSLGEPKFRTKQIYNWLHVKKVRALSDMNNIPKSLIKRLEDEVGFYPLKIARVQESKTDGTRKYLFELKDHNLIEAVFMKYKHGNSVCISSQVGCRMGCSFCASTIDGLERNLYPAEMLDEIYAIEQDTGERVSNIVVMGSGEPMDNLDNLLKFIGMISDENGLNISQRNITVSTCGIVPKIYELAKAKLQITLAISLHASNDEKRRALMPVANSFSIEELLKACRDYFDATGRRISFEYALVAGVNDTGSDAIELGTLLKGMNCHVNLIPVNPIKERTYQRSNRDAVIAFKNKLEKYGFNVTIRRELGADIDGACGQLRRRVMTEGAN